MATTSTPRLLVLLASLVATRNAERELARCREEAGGCASPASQAPFSTEQLLIQTRAGGGLASAAKESGALSSGFCYGLARRRRRAADMNVCRRRHSAPGWDDTDLPGEKWTCNEASGEMECDGGTNLIGYPASETRKSNDFWCAVDIPPPAWNLKHCPETTSTPIKILTYNLYWWKLFGRHGGGDRSAGRLIARTAGPEQYDLMAFQECDDVHRVLEDARVSGLEGYYHPIGGGRALSIAYRASRWTLLGQGSEDVGEDSRRQYYGKRSAMWVRLRHRDGKTVFFVNHHGPLKVSEGGGCTGSANAMNVVRVIAQNAHHDDAIILVGDFNARRFSTRIRELDRRLVRVFTGLSMGGIDHVFSNCHYGARGRRLGRGDGWWKSDHDAISVNFVI